jgi:polyisoprenoid-binding protein YceI
MRLHRLVPLLCLATLVASVAACKKEEDKPSGASHAPAAPAANTAVAADDSADHVTVLARHRDPKPEDPVRLDFDKFKVVKASFDPGKVEGGGATIEIDLSSFHSQSDERDENLRSPSYLDVGKFATANIDIDNVKKTAGNSYTADANVTVHGVTKKYPVKFEVIDTRSDSIRIKAEHTFSRLDFGVGGDPAQDQDESVGADVTVQMVLTLAKAP